MTTGASNPNNPVVFFDITVGGQVIVIFYASDLFVFTDDQPLN